MRTFLSFSAAVSEGRDMGGVVGQVTLGLMGRVGAGRAWIGRGGGEVGRRRRRMVVCGGEVKVSHASALLYDWSIRQSHPEQLDAGAGPPRRRARPGVVAVVAAVGAPPSHADCPPRDSVQGGRDGWREKREQKTRRGIRRWKEKRENARCDGFDMRKEIGTMDREKVYGKNACVWLIKVKHRTGWWWWWIIPGFRNILEVKSGILS